MPVVEFFKKKAGRFSSSIFGCAYEEPSCRLGEFEFSTAPQMNRCFESLQREARDYKVIPPSRMIALGGSAPIVKMPSTNHAWLCLEDWAVLLKDVASFTDVSPKKETPARPVLPQPCWIEAHLSAHSQSLRESVQEKKQRSTPGVRMQLRFVRGAGTLSWTLFRTTSTLT